MEYQWKQGARINGMDAQRVGERLESIRQKSGVLTPKAVVLDASRKTSPLHKGFEWDDSKAAAIYREDRARTIMRCMVVTIRGADSQSTTVRAFVHVGNPAEYEDIHTVMSVPEKRGTLLALALSRMEALRVEFGNLEELAAVWSALDEVSA